MKRRPSGEDLTANFKYVVRDIENGTLQAAVASFRSTGIKFNPYYALNTGMTNMAALFAGVVVPKLQESRHNGTGSILASDVVATPEAKRAGVRQVAVMFHLAQTAGFIAIDPYTRVEASDTAYRATMHGEEVEPVDTFITKHVKSDRAMVIGGAAGTAVGVAAEALFNMPTVASTLVLGATTLTGAYGSDGLVSLRAGMEAYRYYHSEDYLANVGS